MKELRIADEKSRYYQGKCEARDDLDNSKTIRLNALIRRYFHRVILYYDLNSLKYCMTEEANVGTFEQHVLIQERETRQ